MRINKNIVAKSKLLLNPLFPTLKKGIIQLFIVSLSKVPKFWCFFSNTKLLIFGNFYFIIEISLNNFNDKIDEFLYRIQEQILKYAKENDGINSIKVQLSKEDLHKLRHQYLHRSNQDDDMIAMYGRYKEGKPRRDILEG